MEQTLADLIQRHLEESRLKAMAAYAAMYDCPPEEVECMLTEVGPDMPTVTWSCWRRGSFHVSEYGQLDLGLEDAEPLS